MLNLNIKPIIEKIKKVHPAPLFIVFSASFFFGDFFMLRAEAYTLPLYGEFQEFAGLFSLGGVYVYMAVGALINAAFVFFASRLLIGFSAFRYGFSVARRTADLYLEFFITLANIVLGFVNIAFAANPYLFIRYIALIRFAVLTVGYIFFAYYFIKDRVPDKNAKELFKGLAALYFGVNIVHSAITLLSGGLI
ncbi:MAG: hypothetical protein LBP62_04620 [Clostridiales bacterium]|jgi:hypothetical protein|nr:hypothetical protein [Clostridiales bacterium]